MSWILFEEQSRKVGVVEKLQAPKLFDLKYDAPLQVICIKNMSIVKLRLKLTKN